jgi:hypothetical protein
VSDIFLRNKKMIIRAITTNHGKTIDRYSVYLWNGTCLTLSANPDSPQGFSQWGEYFGINDSDFETGKIGDETMINWFDLPHVVQAHIEKRIKQK